MTMADAYPIGLSEGQLRLLKCIVRYTVTGVCASSSDIANACGNSRQVANATIPALIRYRLIRRHSLGQYLATERGREYVAQLRTAPEHLRTSERRVLALLRPYVKACRPVDRVALARDAKTSLVGVRNTLAALVNKGIIERPNREEPHRYVFTTEAARHFPAPNPTIAHSAFIAPIGCDALTAGRA